MKQALLLSSGLGVMAALVAVLANWGHVGLAFFSRSPRWWALPVSILGAVVALLVAFLALKWSNASQARARRGLHVFLVLLIGGALFVPLLWLLAATVGTATAILIVPYDLAVASVAMFFLRRLGVLT